jgi:lambda repressor-like predicted transcriptional regulator
MQVLPTRASRAGKGASGAGCFWGVADGAGGYFYSTGDGDNPLKNPQANYIKGEVKKRGLGLTGLAQALGLPYGTVTGVVNGYRHNERAQRAIAAYLGEPVEDLFQHVTQDSPGEAGVLSKNAGQN